MVIECAALELIDRCMLFHRTEQNWCGIFCKMLKHGMVVSTTAIDVVADLWEGLGVCSPLSLLATCNC